MGIKFESTNFKAVFEANNIDDMKNAIMENIAKHGINEFEYCWNEKGECFDVWGDRETSVETTDAEKTVELIGERVEKFGRAMVMAYAWNEDHTEGVVYDIHVWDFDNDVYKKYLEELNPSI